MIVRDFFCRDCEHEWEDLTPMDVTSPICPNCGSEDTGVSLSVPNIASFSIMSKEDRTAHMKKRSADHSKREMKKDADKWRAMGFGTKK